MPETFNAATTCSTGTCEAGDGDRIAVAGLRGTLTYAELHDLTVPDRGRAARARACGPSSGSCCS